MDSDTTTDKIVLNRIVSLKEDAGKRQKQRCEEGS